MEKMDFIEKLETLITTEDLSSVNRDVTDLRNKLEDFILEEERKIQVDELTAEEEGKSIDTEDRKLELSQLKDQFYVIYDKFRTEYKAQREQEKAVAERNLNEKIELIKRLKEVVQNEENIGAAFGALKEIQEKWKAIGAIPRAKRNLIETEYSQLLDDFFYNIKIYKELKEHDFHRNHQLKLEVITKLKELNKIDSIKQVENDLKELQNDWNDIGPVPNEEWEALKEAYWTEVRSIYNKINRFYDDRREQMKTNIEDKKKVLASMQELNVGLEELNNVKAWDKRSKKVLNLQDEWKKIGFGPKKENESIWKEFRKECDTFFNAKSEFFKDVHKAYDTIAEKKKELIETAKSLKDSTDWGNTAKQLKQLQQKWKQLGHAGIKHEQKLWKEFRKACDNFFKARENHFGEQEKAFEINLKQKEELINAIEKFKTPDDKNAALDALKKITADFNAIGHVPRKDKDRVFKAFEKAINAQYANLDMDGKEKDKMLFEAKVETMKSSPNASALMRNMKFDIRKEIDKHHREITQLENNLGFFSNSKGAESLKKDVEKKVEAARNKIDQLKAQLKMIPNE